MPITADEGLRYIEVMGNRYYFMTVIQGDKTSRFGVLSTHEARLLMQVIKALCDAETKVEISAY